MQFPNREFYRSVQLIVRWTARIAYTALYTDKHKMFSVPHNQTARLTLACIVEDPMSKVVYDQLVKPPSPITDYLTRCVSQLVIMRALL